MTGTGRTWLKTILLLAGLAFGWPGFAARIAMLGISPGLALYDGLFLLLLACLWGTAFIARGWLRWGWGLVFALATLFRSEEGRGGKGGGRRWRLWVGQGTKTKKK